VRPARPAARRQSRRLALQALYAADVARGSAAGSQGADLTDAFEGVVEHFDLPSGAREFADALVRGVGEHRAALDAAIAACASNWRVDRMATVDRNVLRIGAYELMHGDVPASVVINEAIELARDFGTDRSPAFVNGVLDALAREARGESPAAGTDAGA
jgi:N utilization substance protein B